MKDWIIAWWKTLRYGSVFTKAGRQLRANLKAGPEEFVEVERPNTARERQFRVHTNFVKDVAEHKMSVLQDQGVHRHLVFRKPGTSMYHFGLVTWPGHLTIYGDMGCFTFRREHDMFPWFRSGRDINPHYWSEKLQAGEPKEFSTEVLEEVCKDLFDQWREDLSDEDEDFVQHDDQRFDDAGKPVDTDAVWERLRYYVIDRGHSEPEALEALRDYEYGNTTDNEINLSDYYEYSLRDFTFQFLWCCYAIRWGIEQYEGSNS